MEYLKLVCPVGKLNGERQTFFGITDPVLRGGKANLAIVKIVKGEPNNVVLLDQESIKELHEFLGDAIPHLEKQGVKL